MNKLILNLIIMLFMVSPTFAQTTKPIPVAKTNVVVYPRYVMQRLDGSFSSPRFLDQDAHAGELYKVSGAAIKAYGLNSMKARNSLERSLDTERSCWEATKWYYLHNPTRWQPSK